MAQLGSSVVQGSLRVTDTTYTTDLIISGSKTARYALIAPTSAGAPTWRALTNADVGLGNVENTKLSTWTGSTNITTLGTIGTGTWNASTIAVNKGGTGKTSWTQWGVLYASADTTLANTTAGTSGYLLQGNGAAAPSWIQATNNNTASTIVKRDSSGNFSAGTITATVTNATTTEDTTNSLYIVGVTSAASTTLKRDTYAILNKATLTLGAANNEGNLKLFSSGANSKAHIIKGTSTTNDITHTLPNATGWLATGATSGVGSTNAPIYLNTSGILTETGIIDFAHGGTNTSGQADHQILIGTGTSLEWRVLDGSDLTTAIQYQTDTPASTDVVPGTIWLRPTSVSIEDLKCLVVQLNSISGDGSQQVSATYNSDSINQHMVVVGYSFSNPAAVVGDLTWTTTDANPTLTVQGYINGNTNIILYLLPERGA